MASLHPPIAMFRHRQQLRRWAARVLLLWLFGVGAGVANACLATGHPAAAHGHARSDAVGAPLQEADAPTPVGNLAKANCQDFCDKATVSIPPLKSALDDTQSHPAIATTALTVLPMPAFAPRPLWVPRRDGAQAPPIPIVFLRLAL
jgi:hypothetical protein